MTGLVRLTTHPADSRLAVLRLDRPPVNALDQGMWDALPAASEQLHASEGYRAVLITRCFASEDGQRGPRAFVERKSG